MGGEDSIVMGGNELRRVPVIHPDLEQRLTQQQATETLGLTPRHIRRRRDRLRAEDDRGWRSGAAASPPIGANRPRFNSRSFSAMRATMAISGRRSRWSR